MKNREKHDFYEAKVNLKANISIAAVGAAMLSGTICCLAGAGLLIGSAALENKAIETYTTSSRYEVEYNAAKDAELERYEAIERDVANLHQAYLNGDITYIDYREKIDAIRHDMVYGDELDEKLFENSNNSEIVKEREKIANMTIAGGVLLGAGIAIGAGKSVYTILHEGDGTFDLGCEIIDSINKERDNKIRYYYRRGEGGAIEYN